MKNIGGEIENGSGKIAELISRRRRQILVHSVIYYRMDENLILDSTWSKWAKELEELQATYPKIAANQPYAKEFKGFDHSTGCTLPLDDPWAVNKAMQLIRIERRKKRDNHEQ